MKGMQAAHDCWFISAQMYYSNGQKDRALLQALDRFPVFQNY